MTLLFHSRDDPVQWSRELGKFMPQLKATGNLGQSGNSCRKHFHWISPPQRISR